MNPILRGFFALAMTPLELIRDYDIRGQATNFGDSGRNFWVPACAGIRSLGRPPLESRENASNGARGSLERQILGDVFWLLGRMLLRQISRR